MNFQEGFLCPLCDSRHSFRNCRKFLVKPPFEKQAYLRQNRFCINCMGISHQILQCPCRHGCRICAHGHHTLLHSMDENANVWLKMTAWVCLRSPGNINQPIRVRALLDPNAATSYFIPNKFFPINTDKFDSKLSVQLSSVRNNVRTITTTLIKKLVKTELYPPIQAKLTHVMDIYPQECMADFAPHLPYAVNIVLGVDVASRLYLGLPVLERNFPYAQNTIFGWSFFGEVPIDRDNICL